MLTQKSNNCTFSVFLGTLQASTYLMNYTQLINYPLLIFQVMLAIIYQPEEWWPELTLIAYYSTEGHPTKYYSGEISVNFTVLHSVISTAPSWHNAQYLSKQHNCILNCPPSKVHKYTQHCWHCVTAWRSPYSYRLEEVWTRTFMLQAKQPNQSATVTLCKKCVYT